jgi:hypothetical protein
MDKNIRETLLKFKDSILDKEAETNLDQLLKFQALQKVYEKIVDHAYLKNDLEVKKKTRQIIKLLDKYRTSKIIASSSTASLASKIGDYVSQFWQFTCFRLKVQDNPILVEFLDKLKYKDYEKDKGSTMIIADAEFDKPNIKDDSPLFCYFPRIYWKDKEVDDSGKLKEKTVVVTQAKMTILA